jgi:imidazolonepropionase
MKLIGPFTQILPLSGLPLKGAIADDSMQVVLQGGVLVSDGRVAEVGDFEELKKANREAEIEEITGQQVLMPYTFMFCRRPVKGLCHAHCR